MAQFVSQLATWRVVIGKDVLVGHTGTHLYQSQLTIWQVVAQNCVKIGVLNISLELLNNIWPSSKRKHVTNLFLQELFAMLYGIYKHITQTHWPLNSRTH